jgi:HAD superfamily hydrolase (TIGR01450 family)
MTGPGDGPAREPGDGPPQPRGTVAPPRWLASSEAPLTTVHDVLLLDLDGTVYRGRHAIARAPESIAAARADGARATFVTNNAARPPDDVAAQLVAAGIECGPDDVLTSAQAAARILAGRVTGRGKVLVVGGPGLAAALTAEGFEPVDRADDDVVAVAQGWSPDVGWRQLAEGAYALARGVPWIASNVDLTVPTARGIAPGNGSFVQLLARVVRRQPDEVAGKPAAQMMRQAVAAFAARRPLVVGDRLDTDIAGAVAAGLPSLLVLTGVTSPVGLLSAGADERPTYVSADLDGLLRPHRGARPDGGGWLCGTARAHVDGAALLQVGAAGPGVEPLPLDALVAAAAAAWDAHDHGGSWSSADGVETLLGRAAGAAIP